MRTAIRFVEPRATSAATNRARALLAAACACFFVVTLTSGARPARAQDKPNTTPQTKPAAATTATSPNGGGPQQIVREGLAFELRVEPRAAAAAGKPAQLIEGEDATVSFKVSYATTKTPVAGLKLSAWMAMRAAGEQAPALKDCRDKIQSFMQGSLRARPDVDLNAYYVLALNSEPNISVIDPLFSFGGSKLLTLVLLRSPGADWVLTADKKRLFVSMPLANQVAVVDTSTWKVVSNIDTGARPTRLRLQPDEKYLWVGDDGADASARGGVTVIDTAELKKAAAVATGAGRHEIAFSADNRYAFVTNGRDGTLSVVDVNKLAKLTDIKVGASPQEIAVSAMSNAVYVASESDGTISVVDSRSHRLLARLQARPGLRTLRFAPGGRYGFALNPKENAVVIFDASTNRVLHDVQLGKAPDQVSFTNTFAYVRSAGTEEVRMIRLNTVGKELGFALFPGGQLPPDKSQAVSLADAIVPAPEGNAVLVANPGDKMIYYYSEGMAAPMGNFRNYSREPKAVMIIDRSLRETRPGVYSTVVKVPRHGVYDVAFLSDSPRVFHCFEVSAGPNPALPKEPGVALRVEYLSKGKKLRVGESTPIRFKLYDTATKQPKGDLKDVRVLVFLVPGIWQKRDFAKSAGEGVYEVSVTPPKPGVYMIFVESASQGVTFKQLPYLTLNAENAANASVPAVK